MDGMHCTSLSAASQDSWGTVFSPGVQSVHLARWPWWDISSSLTCPGGNYCEQVQCWRDFWIPPLCLQPWKCGISVAEPVPKLDIESLWDVRALLVVAVGEWPWAEDVLWRYPTNPPLQEEQQPLLQLQSSPLHSVLRNKLSFAQVPTSKNNISNCVSGFPFRYVSIHSL